MPNGGDWRSLVGGTMTADIQRERANPIAGVLGRLIGEARALGKERRTEAAAGRTAARTAAYAAYPERAAEAVGIEAPTAGAPAGMRPTKQVRGGTTYEAPEPLDAQFFAKEYNKYSLSVDETNRTLKLMNKEIMKKPSFKSWMEGTFPEYAGEVLKTMKATKERASAAEWLETNGYEVSEENVKKLKAANPNTFD